ncbi:RimK family alpha-L-glutamate ligase [Kitasatospora sp. NPDC056446]|uniref:ATP-grasp domain-containing protein n=1 Tax=Kitasatospora sp. NPDC056446 TaxID=3345819 RepID=UPI00369729F6
MGTLALVTDAVSLPLDHDMPPLLAACDTVGLAAEVCHWDDGAVDWSRFEAVLFRSPWTWADRRAEFLDFCDRVSRVTRLLTPPPLVRWALDKRYLAELAAAGVPVVPTTIVEPGAAALPAVRDFLATHPRAAGFVVKPNDACYSKNVRRFAASEGEEAARHIGWLLADGSHAVLQPYVESVDRHGETDLTFFDGVYSHAIRKGAMLLPDGTVHVPTLDFRTARAADEDERAVGAAALAAAAAAVGLDRPLVCGRVDLLRGPDGTPMVLEMELCEPSLNLDFGPDSALRLAEVLADRLTSPGA